MREDSLKEIAIGAQVECTDGSAGKTTNLIVDPKSLAVTHYVVKERASPHAERLVPVDQVVDSTPDLLHLACTLDELSGMEAFRYTESRQADIPSYSGTAFVQTGHEVRTLTMDLTHVPRGELAVSLDSKVEAKDGVVGRVDGLLTGSDTGQITHLLMRKGHAWGQKEVVLPLSIIDDVEGDTVYLTVDKETVSTMLSLPAKWGHQPSEADLEDLLGGE